MSALNFKNPLAVVIATTALVLALACGGAVTQGASPTAKPQITPSQAQSSTPEWQPPPELPGLALERVFGNPTFSRLTNLVQTGGRLFVTEQTGRVMAFPISQVVSEATVFLDIQDRVNDAGN